MEKKSSSHRGHSLPSAASPTKILARASTPTAASPSTKQCGLACGQGHASLYLMASWLLPPYRPTRMTRHPL